MNDNYYPYFHVSEDFLGMSVQMFPAVPKRLAPGEDATTPRICVAPDIASCLRMVAWTDYQDEFLVYGLMTNPVKADMHTATACAVPDLGRSARHQELWLTRKATFCYLGKVRMSRVDLVTGRPCYYWTARNQEYYHPDHDEMTDAQRDAFLTNEAYHQQVAAEMQAEIEAKGGVMVGDALASLHQAMVHDMGSTEHVILVPPEELAKGITLEHLGSTGKLLEIRGEHPDLVEFNAKDLKVGFGAKEADHGN